MNVFGHFIENRRKRALFGEGLTSLSCWLCQDRVMKIK